MCPFCFASVALAIAGMVRTGRLAALAIEVFRQRSKATEVTQSTSAKNNPDVKAND